MSAFPSIGLVFVLLQYSSTHRHVCRPVVSILQGDFRKPAHNGCSWIGCRERTPSVLQTEQNLRAGKSQDSSQSFATMVLGDIWNNPVMWGLALGILLIGPDHLGTLMALSTLTTGVSSFMVGFAWGIGHSIGMILILPLFYLLKKFSTKTWDIDVETWEYWGDYCIGASMILISFYFIYYEHHFIEAQEDGTYIMKDCGCCEEGTDDMDEATSPKFCGSYSPRSRAKRSSGSISRPLARARRSSRRGTRWKHMLSARGLKGAVVGILQGLCCPTGLMGVGFMRRIGSNSSISLLIAFACTFILASGIGSGAITAFWGLLSSNGLSSCCSPRVLYLSSCAVTAFLGILWILANAGGFLHYINYAEGIHHSMHGSKSIG